MICVGLIYAAFCIWYAKVPSDMIITNSNNTLYFYRFYIV